MPPFQNGESACDPRRGGVPAAASRRAAEPCDDPVRLHRARSTLWTFAFAVLRERNARSRATLILQAQNFVYREKTS
jgi:hypothetical protein